MRQLLLASVMSMILMPHFLYAAEKSDSVVSLKTPVAVQQHTSSKAAYTQPVDINQADVAQLETLKGIGPKKADAIVAYRAKHGPFQTVENLTKVKGMGKKSIARLQMNNPGRLVVNKNTKVE